MWTRLTALASFVLCGTVAMFCLRQGRCSLVVRGDRYSARASGGIIQLCVPPPRRATPEMALILDALTSRVSNQDFHWILHERVDREGRVHPQFMTWDCEPDSQVLAFSRRRFTCAQAAPWLLRAMEDDDRFAAAHIMLFPLYSSRWPSPWKCEARGQDWSVSYCGLRMVLRSGTIEPVRRTYTNSNAVRKSEFRVGRGIEFPEGAQAEVRQFWHDRLDEEAFAVHAAVPCGVLLILPLLEIRRAAIRWRRRRQGFCWVCGYDLRASSGACPECGSGGGAAAAAGDGRGDAPDSAVG
jgi:hypothetical protein